MEMLIYREKHEYINFSNLPLHLTSSIYIFAMCQISIKIMRQIISELIVNIRGIRKSNVWGLLSNEIIGVNLDKAAVKLAVTTEMPLALELEKVILE